MTHSFQNRLVGVVVLTAILAIFLPDLLQQETTNETHVLIPEKIPPRPNVMPMVVEQQAYPEMKEADFEQAKRKHIPQFSDQPTIQGVTIGESTAVSLQPETKTTVITDTVSSLRPLPKKNAWTLQVGTFADAANVNRLLKQLSKQGWSVYTVPQTVRKGQLTRVFIGPELDQNRLKSIQKKIKKTLKTDSVILKFQPTHQVG